MFKFLIVFLVSIPALAATPGNAPSTTISAPGANTAQATILPGQLVSGCGSSGSSGCFSLYGYVSSATGGNFYALYKSGTGAQYQVTAGKTAYCFDITTSCGAANCAMQFVSNLATFNNVASISSIPIYQGGAVASYMVLTGPTANVPYISPGVYSFGS